MARGRPRAPIVQAVTLWWAVGVASGIGAFTVALVLLFTAVTGEWSEAGDGDVLGALIGGLVLGGVAGGVAGAFFYAVMAWRMRDEPAVAGFGGAGSAVVGDPWAEPVRRCEQSAHAVVRLLASLPPSPAGDWLASIAETMADKLADVGALADAGRAAIPASNRYAAEVARRHPLYRRLERAADEFAEVADEVGKLTVELHAPLDLEQIRVQLEMLTRQLPLLRRAT